MSNWDGMINDQEERAVRKRGAWQFGITIREALGDRRVNRFLADADARGLNSEESQPRRISWEDKPRPRNIINLGLVDVGGASSA